MLRRSEEEIIIAVKIAISVAVMAGLMIGFLLAVILIATTDAHANCTTITQCDDWGFCWTIKDCW